MILILTNEDDFITNDVIKWLIVQKKPFLRISDIFIVEIQKIDFFKNRKK